VFGVIRLIVFLWPAIIWLRRKRRHRGLFSRLTSR
jgi:hypothetical protein